MDKIPKHEVSEIVQYSALAGHERELVRCPMPHKELTGYAAGELTGRPVDVLIPEGIGGAARGDRFETLCRRADGIPVPVEICLGAIEGPETFLVVTLRDVTALQAGRDIHAVAQNIAVLDDDVTDVDPDAEPDPSVLRDGRLALGHTVLDGHRAFDRIDRVSLRSGS